MNLQEATIKAISEDHNIRAPYDRSKGQVSQIIELCNEINKRSGTEVFFDNNYANHYKILIGEQEFAFNTYRDVINSLKILLMFI